MNVSHGPGVVRPVADDELRIDYPSRVHYWDDFFLNHPLSSARHPTPTQGHNAEQQFLIHDIVQGAVFSEFSDREHSQIKDPVSQGG